MHGAPHFRKRSEGGSGPTGRVPHYGSGGISDKGGVGGESEEKAREMTTPASLMRRTKEK